MVCFYTSYYELNTFNMVWTNYFIRGVVLLIVIYVLGASCTDPVISTSTGVAEGQSLHFTCTYSGPENPLLVQFFKNGVTQGALLDSCQPFSSYNTTKYEYACPSNNSFIWTIKHVSRVDHGGIWFCKMYIDTVFVSSLTTTANIHVPITSVAMTRPSVNTVNVIESTSSVEFVCETAVGNPQATIVWYRESPTGSVVEITTGTAIDTRNDIDNLTIVTGRMTFIPSRSVHGSKIYCTATNFQDDIKTSSSKPTLSVLYAPVVMALANDSAVEGSPLSKTCEVTPGNPAQTSYSWTRNKGGLTQTSATLTLINVSKSDADMYTCRAQNTMSPTGQLPQTGSDENAFVLTVLYKASITRFREINHRETHTVTVNENDPVKFQCLVESNPGSTIQISKGAEEKETKLNANEVQYSAAKVSCLDAGIYTCVAFNKHNMNERSTENIQLYVLCSPRLPGTLDSNIITSQHEIATIRATILAYPEPSSYVWAKLNESTYTWTDITSSSFIQISSQGLQSNLTIVDVNKSDYGHYRMSVTNTVDMFQHNFRIIPTDIPDPPTGFRHILESITETSATIEWIPGYNGGLPQTFYIQYRAMTTISWISVTRKQASESTMNITLNGLKAGSTYDVHSYASNEIGKSCSVQLLFMTKDSADPASQEPLPGAVIGGIVGGLVVLVLVVLLVIVARKYQLSCDFKKRVDNPDTATSRDDRNNTEQNKTVSVSNYNTATTSDASRQYTSLTDRDLSTEAYDTVSSIELKEQQSSSKVYENLNI